MDFKKIMISGIISGIVILVVSTITSSFFQAVFSYNVLELDGMRQINDPIMTLFFVFPWVIGFAMAILYDYTKACFKGKTIQKTTRLGLLSWAMYGIPSTFIVFSSMNYPIGFTINSLVGSLIYLLIGASVIVTNQ
jgi:hypothetical protein